MTKIVRVEIGSLAEECGVEAGDFLISVNGKKITDILEFRFLTTDYEFNITLKKRDGTIETIDVINEYYEEFGVEFENFLMTKAKSCANKCIFCFIDQLPKGMRDTLYFKDDDSRLSFLQGNYITMTNISDKELESIIAMRMSPINVSVHCTDSKLRTFMLGNKRAGKIMEQMKKLSDADIVLNCQIVLCPDINDKKVLDNTLSDLLALGSNVESISVVPVGLTDYRENLYELKSFDKQMSNEVISQIEKWQDIFLKHYGKRIVYASDEFYLMAQKKLPEYKSYDDFLQLENGVGMLSVTEDEFLNEIKNNNVSVKNKKVSIATGRSAYDFIQNLVSKIKNLSCDVYEIQNDYFGKQITVSGLITATDIIKQLTGKNLGEILYIPQNMLRKDTDVFLDDLTIKDIENALNVKIAVISNGTELAKELLY